jgi:hypothetical protein
MESRDHGLEHEADVQPQRRLKGAWTAWLRPKYSSEGRSKRPRRRLGRDQTQNNVAIRKNRLRGQNVKLQSDRLLGQPRTPVFVYSLAAFMNRSIRSV